MCYLNFRETELYVERCHTIVLHAFHQPKTAHHHDAGERGRPQVPYLC